MSKEQGRYNNWSIKLPATVNKTYSTIQGYSITWCDHLRLNFCWYSSCLPPRMARLSWFNWLVTYWDSLPAWRWSPIPVLTGPNVE